ncbi:GNAT family N-acetyltransferase [Limosilactobacillus caecicola]|uniref:GNAT family N-acetyltransferase n=1 Tax=Limosilactobacillus caecicola TaxID=2941332 RepID=UPI00203D9A60|nr:GNAT family N-acetyltransferase [Limosilactobacillus caecicola]
MQFTIKGNQIVATTDDGQWAGDVTFPFVDQANQRVVVERVFVVPEFRNHGLAAQLMDQFVQLAERKHWVVKIMCPYAKRYFKLHSEAQTVLLPEDRF